MKSAAGNTNFWFSLPFQSYTVSPKVDADEQSTTDYLKPIWYPHQSSIGIEEIKREVQRALYALKNGDYYDAVRALRRLLRALDGHPTS